MLKGIIFDLDGTLLNTIDDLNNSINDTFKYFNLDRKNTTSLTMSQVGHGMRNFIEKCFPCEDEKFIDEALKVFLNCYGKQYYKTTKPYTGIKELVDYLISNDYLVGVNSNKNEEYTKLLIELNFPDINEEYVKGIKAGANAYLYKPFNADELKTLAVQLMEQKNTLRKKYSQSLDENSRSNEKLAPSDQEFINKLNDLIHAQMKTGDLNAENIASIMCMSRSQLNRKLMAIAGQNITNYSLQLRIAKAKRMLDADINTPIGEIANACGFEDVSYFSRVFKQMCQMTPSQYRKRV